MSARVAAQAVAVQSHSVLVVSWARPERRNAMDAGVTDALAEVIAQAVATSAAALVLYGQGGDFSAGADLAEVRAVSAGDETAALRYSERLQALAEALECLPVPVVAAIEGVCLGLGLELALAASARVAASDARLGLPEMRHGLYPAAGGTARLPEAIGEGRARAWILDGRIADADAARAAGLVDLVVAPGEAREAALALAGRRASMAQAGHLFLEARRAGRGEGFAAALAAERAGFARLVRSAGVRQRLDAFLDRRSGVGSTAPP